MLLMKTNRLFTSQITCTHTQNTVGGITTLISLLPTCQRCQVNDQTGIEALGIA